MYFKALSAARITGGDVTRIGGVNRFKLTMPTAGHAVQCIPLAATHQAHGPHWILWALVALAVILASTGAAWWLRRHHRRQS